MAEKKQVGVEKRSAIGYYRIKPTNKKRVQDLAKELEISESEMLDEMIERTFTSGYRWSKKK